MSTCSSPPATATSSRIGAEHIGPAAKRNMDVTCVVMDNGIYGLTKGQASPTSALEVVTPTTPLGKLDDAMNPLELFLAIGVNFVASMLSTRPRISPRRSARRWSTPASHRARAVPLHYLTTTPMRRSKGNPKKGIEPGAYPLPEEHDPTNKQQAMAHATSGRIPVGLLYRAPESRPMHQRLTEARERAGQTAPPDVDALLSSLEI